MVFRKALWRSLSVKLGPLWLSLWLFSTFFGAFPIWEQADGTFCSTCAFDSSPQTADECCPKIAGSASGGASKVGAPDDCRQCCTASEPKAQGASFVPSFFAAIVPTFVGVAPVFTVETSIFRAPTARVIDFLPRPPPRLRAPPL